MGIFGWSLPPGCGTLPGEEDYDDCDDQSENWITFTRRTNSPKLEYLESLLDQKGIKHRRNGESFHAPILEILNQDAGAAWDILALPARKALGLPVRYGIALDDVPDDHPCFKGD